MKANQKRRIPHVLRCMLACILCAVFLLSSALPSLAADRDDGDMETGTVTAIGDTTIEVNKAGIITIQMTAKTASAGWKWRTLGFYITRDKLRVDANNLSGAAGKNAGAKNTIWLEKYTCQVAGCPYYGHQDGERHDVSKPDGTTYTKIIISKECITKHLEASGIHLTNGEDTTIYLQGVLAFYSGSTFKYGPFYSVDQAKAKNRSLGGGRDWAFYPRSSGEGWVKRYNIPVTYHPDPTKVRINYYRKNTAKEKEEGASTTWTRVASYNCEDHAGKWTSVVTGYDSLKAGNGLGFSTSDYYYGDKIRLSSLSAPRYLSSVLPGEDYGNYYAYRFSWSKSTGAVSKTTGMRKQYHVKCYSGAVLDKDGVVTQAYKDWLKEVRDYAYSCASAKDGMEINVCYKKGKRAKDEIDLPLNPHVTATIQSDPRGADTSLDVETYDSTQGIPSSEPQYVNVYADNYLYTVGYASRSASKDYSYHSGCYYVPPTYDGKGNLTGGGYWMHNYASTTITCTWEDVTSLGIWKIAYADITNKSLPDKTQRLYPHDYDVKPPDVVYEGGVVSWSPYGTASCGAVGAPDPSQTYCKSGRLVFNGKTILSDSTRSLCGDTHTDFPKATTIGNDVLYESGYVIPPTLANSEYRSKGKITYTSIVNTDTGYSNTLDYDISTINDVVVHTPTVSYASVPNDAKQYCQLVTPDATAAHLVLDQYFSVCDSSYGYHSDLRGYGTRNYTKNENQFIAKKEVQFPFDVYQCNSDGSIGTFYASGTWIELDLTSGLGNFYLPVWVSEGDYTVNFRSRTINCDANVGSEEEQLDAVTELTANTELDNYISSSTVDVEVSGRLFNLTMYDISDYPAWGARVFRQPSSTSLTGLKYTVGLNDRNGVQYRSDSSSKYTFSLVNGSHPYLLNYGVLKPGYVQRFYLTTFGDMYSDSDYIEIRPTFSYVTGSGDNQVRQRVDIYYDETIDGTFEHFVKVGSELDKKNVKYMSIGDLYTSVSDSELANKASLLDISVADLRSQTGARYRYDRIIIPLDSATFVGEKFVPDSGIPDGVSYAQVSEAAQKWYFEYSLPANVHAVPAGTMVNTGRESLSVDEYAARYGIDYTEDFWCKGGYIIVNWSIQTVSSRFSDADMDGGEGSSIDVGGGESSYHLSYTNHANWSQGFCNMWNLEGYQYTKTDAYGKTYSFIDGDILMFYASGGTSGSNGSGTGGNGSDSVRDDYKSYGTH